jgi:hypothetical protein
MWSTRLANDPAIRWLRELVIASYEKVAQRIDEIVAAADIVRPKKR